MFLSTPPSRVATRLPCGVLVRLDVSIHATLAGGDNAVNTMRNLSKVSIHATLAGGDYLNFMHRPPRKVFLSTPPSRVATIKSAVSVPTVMFLSTPPSRVATRRPFLPSSRRIRFYPRHPRGWRLNFAVSVTVSCSVSIHATLAGGDIISTTGLAARNVFLSTPPSRVATQQRAARAFALSVSIHATLAGGDSKACCASTISRLFLSTPPSRVATSIRSCERSRASCFYPRHPRGWRRNRVARFISSSCFYPRHPRGWRRGLLQLLGGEKGFYPRHPRGWRRGLLQLLGGEKGFYPRHPRGWRPVSPNSLMTGTMFLSTPPSRVATY